MTTPNARIGGAPTDDDKKTAAWLAAISNEDLRAIHIAAALAQARGDAMEHFLRVLREEAARLRGR